MKGDRLKLWIAEGFGSGRVPKAPGTVGSLVGIPWFIALLATGSMIAFVAGAIIGIGLSVWLCGEAERISGKHDPGSVVLDEIIAIPICMISWMISVSFRDGAWPGAAVLSESGTWIIISIAWILFRVFDIWKPWPVRQSQMFKGGLGVTADDVLAAVYVNLVMLPFLL